ncbi:MAG: cell division protein ZapA [Burkholderiaceae bacterium]|jgi:cell division protein ZapA
MSQKETLNVNILGRSYTLLCTSDEKATLLASVALVDKKMTTIHQQMGLSGHDKIAVFAALQIANELLQLNLHNSTQLESTQRIEQMVQQIDDAIHPPLNSLI